MVALGCGRWLDAYGDVQSISPWPENAIKARELLIVCRGQLL